MGIKKRRDEKADFDEKYKIYLSSKKKEKLMLILTIMACVGGIIVIMIGLEWGIERLFNYSTPTNWQDSDWQDLSSYWQDSSSYWRTQYNLLKAQQELSEYRTLMHTLKGGGLRAYISTECILIESETMPKEWDDFEITHTDYYNLETGKLSSQLDHKVWLLCDDSIGAIFR